MKIYKAIKDLTQEDIFDVCSQSEKCMSCVLHKACCLTDDLYKFLQKYKRSKVIDCELERVIYIWKEDED